MMHESFSLESGESTNTTVDRPESQEGQSSMNDLVSRFQEADQAAMYDGSWDPNNPSLLLNQLIEQISSIDAAGLSSDELTDQRYALWLWNHHAVSSAIYRSHDKESAKRYVQEALTYAGSNNKITQLFALLLDERDKEAEQYASGFADGDFEKETALELIRQHRAGEWFPSDIEGTREETSL